MKLLLCAFDPFGGDTVNPALEAIRLLPDMVAGAEVAKLEVPTVFGKSIEVVYKEMRKQRPDVVLCVGQAGGRFDVTPERVAINLDDARIADNVGFQPVSRAIFEDGPTAYFSSLPIKAMVQAIRAEGLPASVSNSAGTFVCNHLMYGVLYYIQKHFPAMRGGFIHVPFIPAQVVARQAQAPSMALEDIARALVAAIGAIVENEQDIHAIEGQEH